jgi:hypothetical protein
MLSCSCDFGHWCTGHLSDMLVKSRGCLPTMALSSMTTEHKSSHPGLHSDIHGHIHVPLWLMRQEKEGGLEARGREPCDLPPPRGRHVDMGSWRCPAQPDIRDAELGRVRPSQQGATVHQGPSLLHSSCPALQSTPMPHCTLYSHLLQWAWCPNPGQAGVIL